MKECKKKITMKQLAEDLKLGRQTISAILNGNKQNRKIAPKTEKRVWDYVKKVGYHQSIATMSMQKKYFKDVVIVRKSAMTFECQQVYTRLIENLEQLNLSHATSFYTETKGIPFLTKEIEFFNPKKIIMFTLSHLSIEKWNMLRKSNFINVPLFLFDIAEADRFLCNPDDACVEMNRKKTYQEIAHCMSSGKFTHIITETHSAICKAMPNTKCEIIPLAVNSDLKLYRPGASFTIDALFEAGKYYAEQILMKSFPKGKTAVFIGDDYACCATIEHLQKHSIKVPKDLEFFSLGYMTASKMLKYPFISWEYPYDKMYNKMIEWVQGKNIENKEKISKNIFGIKKVIHN